MSAAIDGQTLGPSITKSTKAADRAKRFMSRDISHAPFDAVSE
jgi:hypothetical protein